VVFDLDGTLIDSRRDLAESANELLVSLGGAPLPIDLVGDMVGDGARALVERACRAGGLAADLDVALARFLAIYDRRLFDHTVPYPGAGELLAQLSSAGLRLCLLTNKPHAPAVRLVEGFGFAPYLSEVIGGDSGLPRKPDPAALLALAGRAGCARGEVLMVGDSRVDLEAARRAGTRFAFAAYGFGARQVPPDSLCADDIRLGAPRDLLAILA
jgi:phosphoglycolate phosphatase